jgi:ketosteroid isomerase-like protein
MADSRNVVVVRRAFDAFSRRDEPALLALLDPAVEFHAPTASLARGGRPYLGHAGMREYLRDAAEVWAELRIEPREFRELDDLVVALGRVYAWGAGRVVDAPAGWVWRVRNGLAIAIRVYETPADALSAVGILGPTQAGQAPRS